MNIVDVVSYSLQHTGESVVIKVNGRTIPTGAIVSLPGDRFPQENIAKYSNLTAVAGYVRNVSDTHSGSIVVEKISDTGVSQSTMATTAVDIVLKQAKRLVCLKIV